VDEAHVEHLVSLVEDDDLRLGEAHGTRLHVVDQPAGRGDEHVEPARQRLGLRAVAHAAEDHGDAQVEMAAVGAEALADLAGEFARGTQHQDATAAADGALRRIGEAVEDGKGESRRLARARLGNAEQVAAGNDVGNGLGLDRSRSLVALALQRLEQRLGEAEIGK